MHHSANLAAARARKADKTKPVARTGPRRDADIERLQGLAASGRAGVDLSKLSRDEIRAHLFDD